jgi:ATP-dependent Lhr-like helicase
MPTSTDLAKTWFNARNWKPFAFQKQWAAVKQGQSGLLHASTGAGKTYAVWFAALNRFARIKPSVADSKKRKAPAEPLTVLWITPMRALAADTARALQTPVTICRFHGASVCAPATPAALNAHARADACRPR